MAIRRSDAKSPLPLDSVARLARSWVMPLLPNPMDGAVRGSRCAVPPMSGLSSRGATPRWWAKPVLSPHARRGAELFLRWQGDGNHHASSFPSQSRVRSDGRHPHQDGPRGGAANNLLVHISYRPENIGSSRSAASGFPSELSYGPPARSPRPGGARLSCGTRGKAVWLSLTRSSRPRKGSRLTPGTSKPSSTRNPTSLAPPFRR
ncbi:MAG: hypothetical protein H6R00_2541 [Proteobacteria bacterium]|nr:hypothetical protein [Pseudomonadota bacterium]